MEARREFLTSGGQEFHYIPCLNEAPTWMAALAEIAEQHMIGWPTIMTPAMREEQKTAAEVARIQAKRLGAER